MPHRLPHFYYLRLKRTFRRLARSAGTPEHIALGVALGVFIAFTPTVGVQMALCVPICLLFRANPLAAVPMVWISNPLTVVPIYSFNYWVGLFFVSGPGLTEFRQEFEGVLSALRSAGVIEAVSRFIGMSAEVLLPLWTGSLIVAAICAAPSYFLALRAVNRIRTGVRLRRARRDARILHLQNARLQEQADEVNAPTEEADASAQKRGA